MNPAHPMKYRKNPINCFQKRRNFIISTSMYCVLYTNTVCRFSNSVLLSKWVLKMLCVAVCFAIKNGFALFLLFHWISVHFCVCFATVSFSIEIRCVDLKLWAFKSVWIDCDSIWSTCNLFLFSFLYPPHFDRIIWTSFDLNNEIPNFPFKTSFQMHWFSDRLVLIHYDISISNLCSARNPICVSSASLFIESFTVWISQFTGLHLWCKSKLKPDATYKRKLLYDSKLIWIINIYLNISKLRFITIKPVHRAEQNPFCWEIILVMLLWFRFEFLRNQIDRHFATHCTNKMLYDVWHKNPVVKWLSSSIFH